MERKRRITPPPNNNNNPAVSTTSSRRRRSLTPRPHHQQQQQQRREYTKEGEQQRYNREYNREALLRKRWHNFLDEYTSTTINNTGEGVQRPSQQKKKKRGKNSPRSVRHPKGSRSSVRKRGRVMHTTKVYGTSSSDDSSSSSSSSSGDSSDSDTSDEEEQPMNRSSGIHHSSGVNNLNVPAVRSSSLPPMMSYHRRSSSNNNNGRENSYYDVYQKRSQSYQFGDQRKFKRKNSRDGSRGGRGNPLDGFAEFLSGEFNTPNTNRSSGGRGVGAANNNRSTTKKSNNGGAQHSRELQEESGRGEEDKMAVLPPLVAYAEFLSDGDHHHQVVETQEKEEVQQHHNDRIPIIRRNSIGNPLTPPLVEKQRVVMVSSPPSSLLREDERRQMQHEEEGRLAVDEQQQQQEQRPQSSTTVEEHYPQEQQHEVHQHFDDDTPFTPWDQTRSSSPLTTIAEESLSNTIDSNRTRDTDVDDDVHHHHHVKFEDVHHVKQDERPSTTTKCDVAKDPEGILNYVMSTGQSSSEEESRIDDSSRSGGTNSSGGGGGASNFKQLMKMPYAKRKSNPIDSDDEDNTPDAPPLSTSGATLSDSITTATSTSTSLHTTNTKQTSQWSVGEGSSSTDTTSDLNIAAIRRVKNEREFNTAVRGGEASPVRSGRGTRLEGHIEKGNNKRVGEKGEGKVAHSPKKKKGGVVSKDKAVKGGGGDNASAVDAIFPKQRRAYSRGSGKKGIRFRDRFMYNWDDGLFDNVAEESSPVPLSCAADFAAGIVSSPIVAGTDDSSAPRGSSPTNTAEDLPECTSSSADTYKRHDTVSSLKTTATMATADSTVFSGGVPTYSRHNSTTSQYTFSSMKSYLSQSQIRRLEDAPPELTDVLHEQIRILKSRRQDILEKARIRNQSGRKLSVRDSIQIENSIEFSLFVMKDKVEQLQQILGPLNVDVELYSTDSSDSGGPCSATTESESSAADGMPFRAAGGALAA